MNVGEKMHITHMHLNSEYQVSLKFTDKYSRLRIPILNCLDECQEHSLYSELIIAFFLLIFIEFLLCSRSFIYI